MQKGKISEKQMLARDKLKEGFALINMIETRTNEVEMAVVRASKKNSGRGMEEINESLNDILDSIDFIIGVSLRKDKQS